MGLAFNLYSKISKHIWKFVKKKSNKVIKVKLKIFDHYYMNMR